MTTPTREQVVQWDELEDIGVVKDDCNGFPWKSIGYTCETDLARLDIGTKVYAPDAVVKAATLARADLEATIAEQAKVIDRLKKVTHVSIPTDTMEQWAASEIRIATQKLRQQLAAQLRDALQAMVNAAADMSCGLKIADDALREHDAKLVERIIDSINSEYHRPLAHIPDKIRKGESI